MFTGIVSCGTVDRVERDGAGCVHLTIRAPFRDVAVGESIAVQGVCLTVVARGADWFQVQATRPTRARTRLGELVPGDRVNLERAAVLGDRLGGHFVQGHVDGMGEVRAVRREGDVVVLEIAVPAEVWACTVPCGSIAVDGVSLTVQRLSDDGTIEVALIPFTVAQTTLGELRPGDRVHLEGDLLGKYVQQVLRAGSRQVP